MGLRYIVLLSLFVLIVTGCKQETPWDKEYPCAIGILAGNTGSLQREDEPISLDIDSIKLKYPDFNPAAFIITDGDQLLASQVEDIESEGNTSGRILFVGNLPAAPFKTFTLRYNAQGTAEVKYPKRTQAELSHKTGGKFIKRVYEGGSFQNVSYLRVPPEHTDHSFFIRYEGPGWESDKVGYRFYLDWRNAVDIFGKKTPDMVLHNVGQDGFESYHQMSGWGMDILKVGESLGLGSIGMWTGAKAERVSVTDSLICAIVANGPVHSKIRTHYYGWKTGDARYDLRCDLGITAGSRLTHCELQISGNPSNLCTGIVKNDSAAVLPPASISGTWTYLATYGRQSLAGDKLGMAILYRQEDLIETAADEQNQVVVLQPRNGLVDYYFLAAWEKEANGITGEVPFREYLEHTLLVLNNPVTITLQ
jgi:hypothetical protein